ncbi:MAG: hypothetical protein ABJM62_01585, partial [Marinomonas sp.]
VDAFKFAHWGGGWQSFGFVCQNRGRFQYLKVTCNVGKTPPMRHQRRGEKGDKRRFIHIKSRAGRQRRNWPQNRRILQLFNAHSASMR